MGGSASSLGDFLGNEMEVKAIISRHFLDDNAAWFRVKQIIFVSLKEPGVDAFVDHDVDYFGSVVWFLSFLLHILHGYSQVLQFMFQDVLDHRIAHRFPVNNEGGWKLLVLHEVGLYPVEEPFLQVDSFDFVFLLDLDDVVTINISACIVSGPYKGYCEPSLPFGGGNGGVSEIPVFEIWHIILDHPWSVSSFATHLDNDFRCN